MNISKLTRLIERVIKRTSYKLSSGETAFFCPFCNHHKRKLQINLNPNSDKFQYWHCWVCNKRGKTIYSLFKQLNIDQIYIDQLIFIVGKYNGYKKTNNDIKPDNIAVKLPNEYIPLYKNTEYSITYRMAMNHLIRDRKLTAKDIVRYKIGFCDDGYYKGRMIIPSYDLNGKLNYFVGRDVIAESRQPYLNPKSSKDIVVFESFISYNHPIVLCEGVFDAIAIKINAIPLMGKYMHKAVLNALIKNRTKTVLVALDPDAMTDSIKICETLLGNGIDTLNVTLEQDPCDTGFIEFWKHASNAKKIDFVNIIRNRFT